jgi:hypothetical protein
MHTRMSSYHIYIYIYKCIYRIPYKTYYVILQKKIFYRSACVCERIYVRVFMYARTHLRTYVCVCIPAYTQALCVNMRTHTTRIQTPCRLLVILSHSHCRACIRINTHTYIGIHMCTNTYTNTLPFADHPLSQSLSCVSMYKGTHIHMYTHVHTHL